MKRNLKNSTKEFAYRCLDLALTLPNTYLGNHVKGQLIRSATSVAANYRACCQAQTKAGFIAKLSIVIEECDESEFWLQLIIDRQLCSPDAAGEILKEGHELTSIFVVSRRTASESRKEKG